MQTLSPSELNAIIKEMYGITLLTCPDCGVAVSSFDCKYDNGKYTCPACGNREDVWNFPDLFT